MKRLVIMMFVIGPALMLCPSAGGASCGAHVIVENGDASSCVAVKWAFDRETKTFQQKPQITASDDPDGSKYTYNIVAACDEPVGSGTGGAVCTNFANCPPKVGPDGKELRADRMQGLRAPRGKPNEMQPFGDAICVYTGKSIPLADVEAAVKEELVKQVGRPQISVQPATRGLIHWPVLFSAPAQHRVTLDITKPLPGAITADPAYAWDLGTGQRATGAGHRYTQSIDPTKASSDGYYVKGSYDIPGEHSVELRLTWSAEIHLGPAVGGLDVDLDPIVFTDTATARVVSATNHLYDAIPPR